MNCWTVRRQNNKPRLVPRLTSQEKKKAQGREKEMKRRMLALMLAFSLAGSGTIFASDQTPAIETEDPGTPITSGELYEAVQTYAPEFQISESSDGHLTFYCEKDDVQEYDVQQFFWKAVKIMCLKEIDGHDHLLFMITGTVNGKLYLESLSLYSIKSQYDFTALHTTISEDARTKSLFEAYFDSWFSAQTTSAKMAALQHKYSPAEYALPDKYENGYIWAMESLSLDSGFSFQNGNVNTYISIENTKEGGIAAYCLAYVAFLRFTRFYLSDPESMPYTTVTMNFKDKSTGSIIWSMTDYYSSSGWRISQTNPSGDFATGVGIGGQMAASGMLDSQAGE